MKVKEIIKILEDWAPLHYQEDYDNSGLQGGNPDMEVTGISICLDITDEILEDAIQSNFNLIISHHPLIFRGLKKINYLMPENNVLIKAIKHDICIYSCHTNLDNIRSGVNQKLARMLELEDIEILRPFSGKLFKYSDSLTEKVLPIQNTSMGLTAVFSPQHWCGWFTLGLYTNE